MSPEPVPTHITAIERPSPPLWTYYVLKAIATTVAFPVTIVVLFFRYHTMRYRFDAEGIHMRWGILIRREVMLNYARIQDIQLRSNFVERWLGLARIEIQTASGSAGAQMTLEGLLNFVEVRDFLYSRMRGARHVSDAAPTAASSESLAGVMTEVARELRTIRQLMEARDRDVRTGH
jgi:putative membrane protein